MIGCSIIWHGDSTLPPLFFCSGAMLDIIVLVLAAVCRAAGILNVHLVPHTHDDIGLCARTRRAKWVHGNQGRRAPYLATSPPLRRPEAEHRETVSVVQFICILLWLHRTI